MVTSPYRRALCLRKDAIPPSFPERSNFAVSTDLSKCSPFQARQLSLDPACLIFNTYFECSSHVKIPGSCVEMDHISRDADSFLFLLSPPQLHVNRNCC